MDGVLKQNKLALFSSARSFYRLSKPTIAMLVVVTAAPSIFIATVGMPSWSLVVYTLLGTFLMAASAGAFNQIVDLDIDQKMNRTKKRPLPSGDISREWASAVSLLVGFSGFVILYTQANPLTAWLSLASHVFYIFVYTLYLKKRTTQNIVIGGAAGAIGPLIGWAAATNSLATLPWLMFLLIFLWTPPHFWALAIKYKDDYSKAGIPMLPSVAGVEKTRFQILLYSISLVVVHALFFAYPQISFVCSLFMFLLAVYFLYLAVELYKGKTDQQAMKLFVYSCIYMLVIFAAMLVDQLAIKLT